MKSDPQTNKSRCVHPSGHLSHQLLALPVPDGLLQLVQLVDGLLPADPARPAVEDVARLALRGRPRALHQLIELVLERAEHGGDLVQDLLLLVRGRQLAEDLDVGEVLAAVVDGAQQKLWQVKLDCLSEPLAARSRRSKNKDSACPLRSHLCPD